MEGKIEVIDKWYITVETSPVNYVVRCGNGNRNKKSGWVDAPRGFFSSIRGAVKFIRDQIVAERLSTSSRTLAEAISTISGIDSDFEKIIERIC